jgi:hypothetical protein
VDKFIHHPPNISNPANIVSLVDQLKEIGEVWDPSQKQPLWKKWLKKFI